jgi:hypothetical protein
LDRINIFIFRTNLLLKLGCHEAIVTDTKLITCSLRQVYALDNFFKLVFEFGAWVAWLCKVRLQLGAGLPARVSNV